jgi:hypothetical protein
MVKKKSTDKTSYGTKDNRKCVKWDKMSNGHNIEWEIKTKGQKVEVINVEWDIMSIGK